MDFTVWTFWEGQLPQYIHDCLTSIKWRCKESTREYRHLDGLDEFESVAGDMLHPNWRDIPEIGVKSDAIRCALLAKFGGLWLDADTICLRDPYEFVQGTPDRDMVYSTWVATPPRVIAGCIYMKPGSIVARRWLEIVNRMLAEHKNGWSELTEKPLYELKCAHPEGCRWIPKELFMPVDISDDWIKYFSRMDPSQVITDQTIMCALNHSRFMAHRSTDLLLSGEKRQKSKFLVHTLLDIARMSKLGVPAESRKGERFKPPAAVPTLKVPVKNVLPESVLKTLREMKKATNYYTAPPVSRKVGLRLYAGVEYYSDHITSENEEMQRGMEHAGWQLEFAKGRSLPELCAELNPDMLMIADRRDFEHWDSFGHLGLPDTHTWRDCDSLPSSVFKTTIYKDMLWWTDWQLEKLQTMGVHAVVVYYDPAIAIELAPWLKPLLVRTYHSINVDLCPAVTEAQRYRCLISGAIDERKAGKKNDPYPLRSRLFALAEAGKLAGCKIRKHPGYKAIGSDTPAYLQDLAKYKVAICTSSAYSFALRKIIEATACGCKVITDLHEELPEIDSNLIRVDRDISTSDLNNVIADAANAWDVGTQRELASKCLGFYDYRRLGVELDRKLITKYGGAQ